MNVTRETMEILNKLAGAGLSAGELRKAFTQATGLVWYDLEAPAKTLYPYVELIPLVRSIPRVKGGGDTATRWKAVTGINIGGTRLGVSEGNRGAVIATSVANYSAAYKGIGLEDYVTFEAGYAAVNFDDPRARAVQGLLRSLMIGEEKVVLGGNTSLALGITPTPSLSSAGTDATTSGIAVSVIAVALTNDGALYTPAIGPVPASIAKVNADGSTDTTGGGSARKSAAAATTPAATAHVNATVAAVVGAYAYAWYWGAAGAETYGGMTYINSIKILTDAGAFAQTAASMPAADNSQDANIFDGILTQVVAPTFGVTPNSYVKTMATGTAGTGTVLTSDNAGGVVEIDDALQSFWDNYRLSPSRILVSSQEQRNITSKIIAGGSAPLYRFQMDGGGTSPKDLTAVGGRVAGAYLNKFFGGGKILPIESHPFMPRGTIVFWSDQIPYQLSDVQNIIQIKTRQEYYQLEWPIKTRKYEFGVYADEVMQNYFPPAFGIITNIANG